MSYKDMKLRTKFIFTLVIMTLLVTIVIGMAQMAFLKMSNMMVNDFVQVEYDNMKSQMSMRKDIQSINKRLLLAMYDSANNPVKEQREDFEGRFQDMRERLSRLEKTLDDKTLLENLSTAMDALEKDSYTLLDNDGNEVTSTPAYAANGTTEIGTYSIDSANGQVTFTPTDKSYTGAVTPAKVQAESSNGIKVDTTYTPEIVPVTPTATPAETEDIQNNENYKD